MKISSPALITRGLNAFYGRFQALKAIDLHIERHAITALIGPSGCGKTTFLRSLNRMNDLIPGFSVTGDVLLDDFEIYGPGVDVVDLRSRVGIVFQRPNPFPLSIIDNVTWALRGTRHVRRTERREKAVDSLKRAGLWNEVKNRLKDPAFRLSGGQQQRLCIARAIATSPTVLLMDEPTSALDPISTETIEELMLSLKEEFTVIFVSHNMQQANRLANACAFFLMGEVVEYGPIAQVFENPLDPRTADYVTGRLG